MTEKTGRLHLKPRHRAAIATAHDYDCEKAKASLAVMADFIDDAIGLYQTMSGAPWE